MRTDRRKSPFALTLAKLGAEYGSFDLMEMGVAGGLEAFLKPRAVAVLGASDDYQRIGGRALFNLVRGGFPGEIYPINSKRALVQGLAAYPSLRSVPGEIDCAVIALPVDAVLPAIEDCVAKGVRAAVIFSAGFAEAGPEGAARQERMRVLARAAGMRIIGPNCLGMYSIGNRCWLSFTSLFQEQVDGPTIGMVSQSGGSASHLLKLAQMRGLAIGTSITTGNEVDVDFGEGLEMLGEDPNVSLILGYIEGIRDGGALMRGLDAARRNGKPVVILKVGRTSLGAQAAASHTASLAGEDRVYDAVFRALGVHRARTGDEMLDIAYLARSVPRLIGNRLGVVTISGGMGAQIADAAHDEGFDLPLLDSSLQAELKDLCPPGSPANPVDITAQLSTDPGLLVASMRLILASRQVDVLYAFFGMYAGIQALDEVFRKDLAELRKEFSEAHIVLGVACPSDVAAAYEALGFALFEEPARAIRALAALRPRAFSKAPIALATDVDPVTAIARGTRFNEKTAKALLALAGIDAPTEQLVIDPAGAGRAAQSLTLPVALKIVSSDILHKSDIGGVQLSLSTVDEVERAAEEMLATVSRACPDARLEGLLLVEMVDDGVDLILGARVDPIFGPLILCGFGGIAAELHDDTSLRLAPVDQGQALEMLRELKSFALLNGFRAKPKLDLAAAANAIVQLSTLVSANRDTVKTIEINPLRVVSRGALALDAVIKTVPQVGGP